MGRVSVSFKGTESMTKQQFRDGTRVDAVLKKYAAIGVDANNVGLFQANVARESFGVADTTYDYQTQLNRILAVQSYFKALPSGIRDKFRNDPAVMLAFMADPKNLDECVKMGLFRGKVEDKGATPVAPASVPGGPGPK